MTDRLDALDAITDIVLRYNPKKKKATKPSQQPGFTFYEFFSGGGMARAGLGSNWQCLFANDFDHKKCAS